MSAPEASYELDPETGAFVIHGYNHARPFSNFLPGIAGEWGIPLWAYYVSRAQAVCSAGVRDKHGQILEFQSFNQAVARVPREGFRTFLQLDGGETWEPFRRTRDPDVAQTMIVHPHELSIRERHEGLGVAIEVSYFTLPLLPAPLLARRVRLANLGDAERRVDWLDGVARLLPSGMDQHIVKNVARHIEGWMGVAERRGVPLFRLKQTAADVERVGALEGGHTYLADGVRLGRGLVVDPEAVFGLPYDYDRPWVFDDGGTAGVLEQTEHRDTKTPCAFAARSETLPAGGELRHTALLGRVDEDAAADDVAAWVESDELLEVKQRESREVVDRIADRAFTVSSSRAFDAYARQDFLDNVMRGGVPRVAETREGPTTYSVFARQNGDLERDYHFFVLEPTYLSQGTGHYRSVLQNRRTDPWFFPEVAHLGLLDFLSLIQLDGYNPLEVRGRSYTVEDTSALDRWLRERVSDRGHRDALRARLTDAYTPGELAMRLERALDARASDAEGRRTLDEAVRELLALSRPSEIGALHEGFWVDHWHYNVDLLETFQTVYPDRLREVLLDERSCTWFDDPDVVQPRHQKAVETERGVRQYGAVVRDPDELERIRARSERPHTVRTRHGDGGIYRSTVLAKLLTLVATRLATLDPAGTGVEMEAGKPGWNDSMNGLPGLFGSGLSETIELRRTVRLLRDALDRVAADAHETTPVHAELADLWSGLGSALRKWLRRRDDPSVDEDTAALDYWHEANELKERYREQVRRGVWGDETNLPLREVRDLLDAALRLLDGLFEGDRRERVFHDSGVPHTYFVNEVTDWERIGASDAEGRPYVRPRTFRQRPVRRFLEGAVHYMKDRPEEARAIYEAVRSSPLYDDKLGMYRACENMEGESWELGRAVGAYPRGWIENESVYLHMAYKYLLEILRSGLCDEFWRDARTALIPFMDPAVYGRSTLEGASFIVSSAYADPRQHGRAFQPRLSGLTVEFLEMWTIATAGEQPFRLVDGGGLQLALAPRLPGWLFTEQATTRRMHDDVDEGFVDVEVPEGAFAFKLMGRVLVVYHNADRRPTWGDDGVSPQRYRIAWRDGSTSDHEGAAVPAPDAASIREGRARRLDVTLG